MTFHPHRIFGFWTGENEMPAIRRACFDSFEVTNLRPVLVTPENLAEFIVPDWPLHPAYELLSPVHRSDYLRPYFMHHHGGGYADIKRQRASWIGRLQPIQGQSRFWGAGYREVRGGTPWIERTQIDGSIYVHSRAVPRSAARLVTNAMRGLHPLMIGNCAFWFKPGTLFTRLWLGEVERRLDLLLPALRKHPAQSARDKREDGTGYPVPWSFLQGDVLGPLALAWWWRLARTLPAPDFTNYMGEEQDSGVLAA